MPPFETWIVRHIRFTLHRAKEHITHVKLTLFVTDHCQMFRLMGLDQDSVMIIHMGVCLSSFFCLRED